VVVEKEMCVFVLIFFHHLTVVVTPVFSSLRGSIKGSRPIAINTLKRRKEERRNEKKKERRKREENKKRVSESFIQKLPSQSRTCQYMKEEKNTG
jgi:hypothetical protein